MSRNKPPRILVVAMADSIHVCNWINVASGLGARLFLFGAYDAQHHAALRGARVVSTSAEAGTIDEGEVGVVVPDPSAVEASTRDDRMAGYEPWRPHGFGARVRSPGELDEAIRLVRPDLVHSMEIQLAGYMCAEASRRAGGDFPTWLLSNWGSDIYLFKKLKEHRPRLEDVARRMDYYLPECRRDAAEVRALGFAGRIFDPIPASGGVDLDRHAALLDAPPPSKRDLILVKGYHGWSGRALNAMAAIRLAAPHLRGLTVLTTLGNDAVRRAVGAVSAQTGLHVHFGDHLADHAGVLERTARARISLGIGISDGICTSVLEAMAFGAFPIQSNTACVDEWFTDGQSGFIVDPHDTRAIADRLIAAATDDDLVDRAAQTNFAVVKERWNASTAGQRIVALYRNIIE